MKTDGKKRSPLRFLEALFEFTIRGMVGCFLLIVIMPMFLVFVTTWHYNSLRGRLPARGPRVPIPTVPAETLILGLRVYRREDCSNCHVLRGANTKQDQEAAREKKDERVGNSPDLTYEGQRNASIAWHTANLYDHHRMFPDHGMPDYDSLPPDELHALASFMATRKQKKVSR